MCTSQPSAGPYATDPGVLSETGRTQEAALGWVNAHPRNADQE